MEIPSWFSDANGQARRMPNFGALLFPSSFCALGVGSNVGVYLGGQSPREIENNEAP
jgi:hypothetical protein